MVTRRLQAERRTGSVHRPKTGVLPTVLWSILSYGRSCNGDSFKLAARASFLPLVLPLLFAKDRRRFTVNQGYLSLRNDGSTFPFARPFQSSVQVQVVEFNIAQIISDKESSLPSLLPFIPLLVS